MTAPTPAAPTATPFAKTFPALIAALPSALPSFFAPATAFSNPVCAISLIGFFAFSACSFVSLKPSAVSSTPSGLIPFTLSLTSSTPLFASCASFAMSEKASSVSTPAIDFLSSFICCTSLEIGLSSTSNPICTTSCRTTFAIF